MSVEVHRCEHCGEPCSPQEGWSEADAHSEAATLFSGIEDAPAEEIDVLCEDCWQEFMTWMYAHYGPPPWPHMP